MRFHPFQINDMIMIYFIDLLIGHGISNDCDFHNVRRGAILKYLLNGMCASRSSLCQLFARPQPISPIVFAPCSSVLVRIKW